MSILLPPPQLLEIAGPDAAVFAQAQFSSDVRALAVGRWQWSAWLSAQGRVQALFHLLRPENDRLLLVLRGGDAARTAVALAPYVFRAKVRLRPLGAAWARGYMGRAEVVADFGAAPVADEIAGTTIACVITLPGRSARWLAVGDAPEIAGPGDASDAAIQRWRASDIDAGLPELDPALAGRFLPAWLGLDRLGAISTAKGCYPGQEVVARLHFKGGNKRWPYRLEFAAAQLPSPGTALVAQPESPGELVCSAWTGDGLGVALAVLAEVAPGTQVTAPSLPGARFRVVSAIPDANN